MAGTDARIVLLPGLLQRVRELEQVASYDCPTRCPVLTYRVLTWRVCLRYALSGTEIGCAECMRYAVCGPERGVCGGRM